MQPVRTFGLLALVRFLGGSVVGDVDEDAADNDGLVLVLLCEEEVGRVEPSAILVVAAVVVVVGAALADVDESQCRRGCQFNVGAGVSN